MKRLSLAKDNASTISKIESYFKQAVSVIKEIDTEKAIKVAEWTRDKGILLYNPPHERIEVYPNFVYWAYLGENIGSEENKHRPVLIIRSHPRAPICQVLPLTSQRLNDGRDYHIDLEVINSTVLIEQLRAIDVTRIEKPRYINGDMAILTPTDWKNVDDALNKFYRLKPLR